MEDRLKAKVTMIEKLELKNAQLKGQRAKLGQRVAQKDELCDMLHVVDFDQLKIENQQCLERVEAKNKELLDVKVTTGNTVQVCAQPDNVSADIAAADDYSADVVSGHDVPAYDGSGFLG
jgi:hypothetical protein